MFSFRNRIFLVIVSLVILFSYESSASAASYNVDYVYNNQFIKSSVTPSYLTDQGKVMIPASFLKERFDVNFTISNDTITLKSKINTAQIDLKKNQMTINNQILALETAPIVIKKEYFFPISVLEKLCNTKVEYASDLHWLVIYDENYYASHLHDFVRVGKALWQSIQDGETAINVYDEKRVNENQLEQEINEADKICDAILYKLRDEEPLFFNLENWSSTSSYDYDDNFDLILTYQIEPEYLYSTEIANKMKATFDSTVNNILKKVIKSGMTEYQKELVIHDYIVKTTKYDLDTFTGKNEDNDSYTAYGVIVKHKAVCDGYAKATKILLNRAGIKCDYIDGSANGNLHAWDQVFIEGQWYQLDTTWDDPTPDVVNKVSYDYFNIPDIELQQDHYWDKSKFVVCKSDTMNYYNVNKQTVYSQKELESKLTTLLKQHKNQISLKAKGFAVNGSNLSKLIFQYAKSYSYYPLEYKSYSKVTFVEFTKIQYKK